MWNRGALAVALFGLSACGGPSDRPGDDDPGQADAAVDAPSPSDAADTIEPFTPPCAQLPCTIRVSVSNTGAQSSRPSFPGRSTTADGRFVTFTSDAADLVGDDTNNANDVFMRDVATSTTTRLSVGPAGQGNMASFSPYITPNGRYVLFDSAASNLVPGSNGNGEVLLLDRTTGELERINVSSSGATSNSPSSTAFMVTPDGRYVAFSSNASNLVDDDHNTSSDTFLRDRVTHTTVRTSASSTLEGNHGSLGAQVSADGNRVVFFSSATNFVPGDTNGAYDVFLRDVASGTLTCLSVNPQGIPGNAGASWGTFADDGHAVVFQSMSSDLVDGDTNNVSDLFIRDLDTNLTTRITQGVGGVQANGDSGIGSFAAGDRFVLFTSTASNLVPDDTNGVGDAFVFDRQTGTTTRVSVGEQGQQGNAAVDFASISNDGSAVVFSTSASNLVAGDTNNVNDIFVRYLPRTTVID